MLRLRDDCQAESCPSGGRRGRTLGWTGRWRGKGANVLGTLGGAVTQSSGASPRQESEGAGGAGTDQAGIRSALQPEGLRVLDKFLDSSQEQGRLATVHDAVIEAERHVHHRADDDLTAPRDGPLLDLVKA